MDLPSTSSAEVDDAARLPHSRVFRFRPILFQRATSAILSTSLPSGSSQDEADSTNTAAGQEARDFYEKLIAESPQAVHTELPNQKYSQNKDRKQRKRTHSRTTCSTSVDDKPVLNDRQKKKLANNFFQGAQDGDLKKVKEALKQGCAINSTDDFQWTALMCACHSGQIRVVKYLLQRGALWEDFYDKKGRSALDLAKAANHIKIHELLISNLHSNAESHTSSSRPRTRQHHDGYSCKICKMDFTETSKTEHESSTVHLFNCQHKPHSTLYHIPEGNIGFKLLLKDGWDKEHGLGPEGKGAKFPVKTILKRDRQGLGANPDDPRSRPRVTHFQPNDAAAVEKPKNVTEEKTMRANTLSRKKRQKKELKERAWEIDFRQSFNTLE